MTQNMINDANNNQKVVINKAEEFRKYIEIEVLKVIKDLTEKGTITNEKLIGIAQLTLDLIKPGMTLEELYKNAVKLDDQFSELAPVVYRLMKEFEDKYHQKTLEQVSDLIKSQKYDEAQEMVKKLLAFKVQ